MGILGGLEWLRTETLLRLSLKTYIYLYLAGRAIWGRGRRGGGRSLGI